MAEVDGATLWLVSGGASLFFLAWALVQLRRIGRAGSSPARKWFQAFLLAMVALVLAGVAAAVVDGAATALVGAGFATGGYALHRAAATQRAVLEEARARGG